MNNRLPYTRVVNVSHERRDNLPTIQGFGVPLILSGVVSDVTPGAVDAAARTKVYGTKEEVAADWSETTEAYKEAEAMFGMYPAPAQVKIGYIDPAGGAAELDTLWRYDNSWYVAVVAQEAAWMTAPQAALTDYFEWFSAVPRMIFAYSMDANHENPADTTCISAVSKGLYDRAATFYIDVAGDRLAAREAAHVCTQDLDAIDSHYTAKFTKLTGSSPVDKDSAAVQAITGFVPNIGLDKQAGHYANTYIDIHGSQFLVEGNVLSGAFIDEIHTGDYLVARTEEEILSVMTTNKAIAYTDKGIDQLVQAVNRVMTRAKASGLIEPFPDPLDETVIHEWQITVPRASSVAVTKRRARIAPRIECKYRYSGAIHYSTVHYVMTF